MPTKPSPTPTPTPTLTPTLTPTPTPESSLAPGESNSNPLEPTRSQHRFRRLTALFGVLVYMALLAWSHRVISNQHASALGPAAESGLGALVAGEQSVQIPRMDDAGPILNLPPQRIAYRRWEPDAAENKTLVSEYKSVKSSPVVVLLHGSPGSASNFSLLGPALADRGYSVLAPDLPGFGASSRRVPSYSILAHARAVLALLDTLGIDRFHVVGWSQGGGVALHMTDLAPQRTASLTMLASIGDQRAEGSGSYAFEHAKYALGYVGLVMGAQLVPHFGVLGSYEERNAFIRNFWDSDQRPLRTIMEQLHTPTLIIHGVHDPLVPLWGARLHHKLIKPSTLLVLDASHFIPFTHADQAADAMAAFFARIDTPGSTLLRQTLGLGSVPDTLFGSLHAWMSQLQATVPFWVVLLVLAAGVAIFPELGAALVCVMAAFVWLDVGVAWVAMALGMMLRSVFVWRRGWQKGSCMAQHDSLQLPEESELHGWQHEFTHRSMLSVKTRLQPWCRDAAADARGMLAAAHLLGRTALPGFIAGSLLWAVLVLFVGYSTAGLVRLRMGDALPTLIVATLATVLAVRVSVWFVSWTGRRRMLGKFTRWTSHEFWPSWIFYLPLMPWMVYLGIRHKGLMTFTCANPAIDAGGGVVGESKHAIVRAFAGAGSIVLSAALIEPGASEERIAQLREAMDAHTLSSEYPIILKPDAGQRGYAIRLARNEDDARAYLQAMPRPVVAQSFHAGPHEIGCMWVRTPNQKSDRKQKQPEAMGRIFSVTIKDFAFVVGDGKHTIEQLIYRHTRYRAQADMFLVRLAGQRLRVPEQGEQVRLNESGNHAQGTLFRDGKKLMTPEFARVIDRVVQRFAVDDASKTWQDNGLDFGRFDIRYAHEDDLRTGSNLGIIEFNGTSAESTNLYDPKRSVLWAYSVLFSQWRVLYQLGARRRSQGVKPMSLRELYHAWRTFNADLPPMHVAD